MKDYTSVQLIDFVVCLKCLNEVNESKCSNKKGVLYEFM